MESVTNAASSDATAGRSSTATPAPAPPQRPAEVGPWRCAADPSVETYLRCGRCETPICPRCLVQSSVGARCRACGRIPKLPMFVLGPKDYAIALGAGLGAGIVGGIVLALALGLVPLLGILRIVLVAGLGYAVGEAVARTSRRKRGNALGVIAGLSAVTGVLVGQAVLFALGGADPVLAMAAAAAVTLRSIWSLLGLVIAAAVAFSRVR